MSTANEQQEARETGRSLAALEVARDQARALLEPLFLRIIRKRHPVGSTVHILRDGRLMHGHPHGFTEAIVLDHHNENVFRSGSPELSEVWVRIAMLDRKGGTTNHKLTLRVPVIPLGYAEVCHSRGESERDVLIRLIAESAPAEHTA